MREDRQIEQNYTGSRHPRVYAGAVYGLGALGAGVYFVSHATGFWMSVLGVLKALFWPAFLVYDAFSALGV